MASQSDANQKMLAERQQAMMEFIGQSNAQLTEALTQSQAAAQAQQLQTALQQVGNLFATYQTRTRDLQEELKSAQPSEVVIDLNTQMAENSDELIRQILEQLDQAQQQQPDQSPPQEES
jgi:DNA-binding ferritin-like protein